MHESINHFSNITPTSRQWIYKSEKGTISLIDLLLFHAGLNSPIPHDWIYDQCAFEIYQTEGNGLIDNDDVERFETFAEAEKRIEELLKI